MKTSDRNEMVYGRIYSLSDYVPWTTGFANMLSHLAWETDEVLGITKTSLCKMVISETNFPEFLEMDLDKRYKYVEKILRKKVSESESDSRYGGKRSGYCSPREAVRRAMYFSEDYLNKEFDVFVSLCSDFYLDKLYGKYTPLTGGGNWSTHGHGGLFEHSFKVNGMQMDNLAYNESENVLVGNELKLGGPKTKDQILKYSSMYAQLKSGGLISSGCQFVLLFISDICIDTVWGDEIDREIEFCRRSDKKTHNNLLTEEVIATARSIPIHCLTWNELVEFNKLHIETLSASQQVEKKLMEGFNASLSEKAAMQISA